MNVNQSASGTSILLPDGRNLGYAEYGKPSGIPVFFFHGSGGSRLDRPADVEILNLTGVRLISVERPGHGLSDFQTGRSLLDWSRDVSRLADSLRVEKFSVIGWSAGGPHALACAHQLPGRVLRAALVACPSPMNRPGAFAGLPFPNRVLATSARHSPVLTYLIRRLTRWMLLRDPEGAARQVMASIPEADKAALFAPENLALFIESTAEGFRSGWRGVAWDDILIRRDWGFELKDIHTQIDLWHGTADVNVPFSNAQYLVKHLPGTRSYFLPGEGHFFLLNRWKDVVQALVKSIQQEISNTRLTID